MKKSEIIAKILELKVKKGVRSIAEKLKIQKLQQKLEQFYNKK